MRHALDIWRDPFSSGQGLFDLVKNIEEGFSRTLSGTDAEIAFRPMADVQETDKGFLMSFDLPGTKPEDIKLDIKDATLTVSGERKSESVEKGTGNYRRIERAHGRFERSFTFPLTVDLQKTEAHFENGVLQITIPKKEAVVAKSIPIQIGKATKTVGEKH